MGFRSPQPFRPNRKRDHPLLILYLEQLRAEGKSWSVAKTAGRSFTEWLASGPLAGPGVTSVSVDLSKVTSDDLTAYQSHAPRISRTPQLEWKQTTLDDLIAEGTVPMAPEPLGYHSTRGYCIQIWDWIKFLYLRGRISWDPTVGAPRLPKRPDKALGRILSASEVEAFLKAVVKYSDNTMRDLAAFGCLSGLGLRSCELLRMAVGDVDTKNQRNIKIFGKGRHERVIPLDGCVLEIMDKFLEFRQATDPSEPLWYLPGQRRGLKYPELLARFHRFKRLAGITGKAKTPHAFRHYFITEHLLKGHNPEVVSMFVGHNSPRELETYFHMSDLVLRNRIYQAYGFDVTKPFGGI